MFFDGFKKGFSNFAEVQNPLYYCVLQSISIIIHVLDWLQSLKQFFINVSYHILVASLTLMDLKTDPSELDWLQVYDMTH